MRNKKRRRERAYEKELARKRIRRTKSNSRTYVGYCHHCKHKGHITPELLAGHNCVEKDCHYFSMCNHPIWTDSKYKTGQIKFGRLGIIKSIINNPDPEDHPHIKRELQKLKIAEECVK